VSTAKNPVHNDSEKHTTLQRPRRHAVLAECNKQEYQRRPMTMGRRSGCRRRGTAHMTARRSSPHARPSTPLGGAAARGRGPGHRSQPEVMPAKPRHQWQRRGIKPTIPTIERRRRRPKRGRPTPPGPSYLHRRKWSGASRGWTVAAGWSGTTSAMSSMTKPSACRRSASGA
jgi:hypothetical protein